MSRLRHSRRNATQPSSDKEKSWVDYVAWGNILVGQAGSLDKACRLVAWDCVTGPICDSENKAVTERLLWLGVVALVLLVGGVLGAISVPKGENGAARMRWFLLRVAVVGALLLLVVLVMMEALGYAEEFAYGILVIAWIWMLVDAYKDSGSTESLAK